MGSTYEGEGGLHGNMLLQLLNTFTDVLTQNQHGPSTKKSCRSDSNLVFQLGIQFHQVQLSFLIMTQVVLTKLKILPLTTFLVQPWEMKEKNSVNKDSCSSEIMIHNLWEILDKKINGKCVHVHMCVLGVSCLENH